MAKAEAAEQKAQSAKDAMASELAWREAGRLWQRASDGESDAKRRNVYAANAERARARADEPPLDEPAGQDAPPVPTN